MRRRICLLLFVVYLGTAGYCQKNSKYTVKKDDSAAKIAKQHGIKLKDFMIWNSLDGDNPIIQIGQQLWITDPQSIQQELLEKPEQVNEAIVSLKKEVTNPNTEVSPQQTKQETERAGDEDQKTTSISHLWVRLLFGLLTGLTLGVILVYVFFVKKLKAKLECKENELDRANSCLSSEKTNTNAELSRLRSKIQTLEREKRELLDENVGLGEEIDRLKVVPYSYLNENNKMEVESNSWASNHVASSVTMYADAIIDGYFVRVREIPNEDSIFVLHLNREDSAAFEIYESAYKRVVANPSFLEGCEKQIIGESSQLEIVTKGMAQKDFSNGKWKVINKLNVIIR